MGKEAKLEAKQLKLQAKQSKLASKLNNVSKQLDQQNENENPTKLVKKQEKLKKQQFKIKKQVDKLKNKTNVCQQQRMQNAVNHDNKNKKNQNNDKVIIDEQQLLDDIANAAVKDLENELQPPLLAISCVCGATLHKTTPVQAYNDGAQVNCDICGKFCPPTAPIYHCPNLKSVVHSEGYDLCGSCVEYQMQGFMPIKPIKPIKPFVSNVVPQQPIPSEVPIDIVPDVVPPEPQK